MNYISLYNNETIKGINVDYTSLLISSFWQAKYLNRKIIESISIDHNGYYPSDYDEDYQYRGVITNVKPILDDDYVESIEYYKVEDRTSGHGRPNTRDINLTSKDIKAFEAYLESITIPNETEESVIDLAKLSLKNNTFVYGWKVKEIKSKSIIFVNNEGEEVPVKIQKLLLAYEISHKYLEVIDNTFFWEANKKHLDFEHMMPIMSLLSYADTNSYYSIDKIKDERTSRLEEFDYQLGYCCLCHYTQINDYENAKKYTKYAKGTTGYNKTLIPAIYSAVKNNNKELATAILKNGSIEANTLVDDDNERKSAVYLSVKKDNLNLLQLLLKYTKKNTEGLYPYQMPEKDCSAMDLAIEEDNGDLVRLLLEYGYPGNNINKLSDQQFTMAVSSGFAPIEIPVIQRLAALKEYDSLKKMIKVSKYEGKIDDNERKVKHADLISYIIREKLYEVLDYAIKEGYDLKADRSYTFKGPQEFSADIVYESLELDDKYAKKIPRLFMTKEDYDKSLAWAMRISLAKRELDKCEKLSNKYNAHVDSFGLGYASGMANDYSKKKKDENIVRFAIDNCKIDEKPKDDLFKELSHFNWIYQGALSGTSKELCYYFFDHFKYFDYSDDRKSKLNFYLSERKDGTELYEYAVEKGIINSYEKGREPENLREYIYSKCSDFKKYQDFYDFCNENEIAYHGRDYGKLSTSFCSFCEIERKKKPEYKYVDDDKNGCTLHIVYDGNEFDLPIGYDEKNKTVYDFYYKEYSNYIIPFEIVNICNKICAIKEKSIMKCIPEMFKQQAKELGLTFDLDVNKIDVKKLSVNNKQSYMIARALSILGIKVIK